MDFIFYALYFIAAIFPLVVIHEFGHFIAARLTGTRADVFAVGMGPRLFGWNKITGFTFGKLSDDWDGGGHTDYRLCAFPIGGYVKIVGMVDESFDTQFANKEPKPWEFRAKNAMQKTFMITAGVIMNFLFAIVLLVIVNWTTGKIVTETKTIGHIEPQSIWAKAGLIAGDKILAINGKNIEYFDQLSQEIVIDNFGKDVTLLAERNSNQVNITIPSSDVTEMLSASSTKGFGIVPDGSLIVMTGIETLRPAGKAGFKANDSIIKVNDVAILTLLQFQEYLAQNKGTSVAITVRRADATTSVIEVTPDENGKIGAMIQQVFAGPTRTIHFGFVESLSLGWNQMISYTNMFVQSIGMIINGKQSFKQSAGGPIAIAKMATQSAAIGASAFLTFMATLSVTLAVMNLLPIPALDGGHLVFIIIEAIIRREVPIKVKMAFQNIGVVLLLLLMAFVFYNDLTR